MIGVIGLLKADAGVLARVSLPGVYPHSRPQKSSLPAVSVSITSVDPSDTKSGISTLDQEEVSVVSYATTYEECYLLSEDCRLALDRASGTYSSHVIQNIDFLDHFSDEELVNDKKVFFIEQNYKVRLIR